VAVNGELTCPTSCDLLAGACEHPKAFVPPVREWDEQDDHVVVHRVDRNISEEIHNAVFPVAAPTGTPQNVKGAIRKYIREKYDPR
jgi:hypothetical protein